MDRRTFIRAGMLTAGSTATAGMCQTAPREEKAAGPQEKAGMKYRALGRTGLEVSEVCFGTYGWQDSPVLEAAIASGVNLVCTCSDYQDGAAERAIAPSVAKHRDSLAVLSGLDCFRSPGEQEMLERLDISLENLGTGYLDFWVPHQADTVENVADPAIPRAFEKMKKAGKARHLGISTHSKDLEAMLNRAIDLGYYELILCKYNFMEYTSQMEIFERAAEKGIGVIVFKVRAGARESEVEALQKKGLELGQARVRWALSNPNVSSVCAHFSNFSAVDSYLEAVSKQLSLGDARLIEDYRRAFASRYCRSCGTCAGRCPHGVDVAGVMRYHMYFKYYGFEKEAMARYAALPQGSRPLACSDCPAPCEAACPHGLSTRRNLVEAAELLAAPRQT
ncbi:MAG: aldo/keto reductase [Candidatus Glassbacteria bacterium]|nr:aldo/keto reductase [Candidatus Glassbacteria bacterium]